MQPLYVFRLLTMAGATATGLLGLALTIDPLGWLSQLVTATTVFVALPWVIAVCLGVVCVPLCLFVIAVGVLARLRWPGRRSGAWTLVVEALALPRGIVPRYYRALTAVHSPLVWGFAAGVVLAVLALGAALASGVVAPAGS